MNAKGQKPEWKCDLLFVHHQTEVVTCKNYESFQQHAPGNCRVIPVHLAGAFQSHLPGSLEVTLETFPKNRPRQISGTWSEVDLVILAYYEQHPTAADFLIQVEWDVRAHAALDELLNLCAEVDCVGKHRHFPVYGYWAEVHTREKGAEWLVGKSQMIPLAFRSVRCPGAPTCSNASV
jgi:hypothetical protein